MVIPGYHMNTDSVENLLDEGFSLLDSGQAHEARAIFERVCEIDAGNAEAWKMRGALYGESGAVREALECLEQAIKLDDGDAESHIIKARLLIQQGNYRDAEVACDRSVEIEPDMADAWLVLGVTQVHLGKLAEAEKSFRQAIELDPGMQEAQANLEMILTGEDVDAVISRYEAACSQEPGSVERLVNLAWAYRRADRLDEAIRCFERASDIGSNVAVVCGLADALIAAGYSGEAEYHLLSYLEHNPDDVATRTYYANQLLKQQKTIDAIREFESALEIQPAAAEAHYGLGCARQEINDYPGASSAYRQAIKYNPGLVIAHMNLAARLIDAGEEEEGVAEFREVLRLQPDSVQALLGLANYFLGQGSPQRAMENLDRAAAFQPENADIYSLQGRAYADQGLVPDCLRSYRRAVELAPDNVDIFHNYVLEIHRMGDTRRSLEMIQGYNRQYGMKTGLLGLETCLLAHTGDERARELMDYEHLVMESMLDVPEGFDSLQSFTGQLSEAVLAHPTLTKSPKTHATRYGRHTGNLFLGDDSIFSLLEQQVRNRFEHYVKELAVKPDHPVVLMRTGKVSSVAWAVVMDNQGHQIPHTHPGAWLSGVCYLQVPAVISDEDPDKGGWIEFGPVPAYYACDTRMITRAIKPELGKLILFPSYAFHNTIPFRSDKVRISLAFDVMPK